MNEELKIIIKAVNTEAKKSIAEVKNALQETEQQTKTVDVAMKNMAKGVAIAIGAVTALATAMIGLTKRSMEFQKSYGRLISGFQSSGSTVKQATETYKNLFRFLGEADTATEAANLLVQLTNDEKKLAEWTKILQGVYAKLPDSIPVETLAEAANETAKTGKVTGTLADALNWLGVSEDAMNQKLATTNSFAEREAILRSTLNQLYGDAAILYERNNSALLAYNESQANLDIALANATRYVIPLMTSLNNLAAVTLQVLKPAFETISATLVVFVQWIVAAIQYIGSFFGLFGEEGVAATQAVSNNIQAVKQNTAGLASGASSLGGALNKAASAAEKLKKQTMGFDELNVMTSQTSTATGSGGTGGGSGVGGGGGGIIPSIEGMDFKAPGLEEFQKKVDEIKGKLEPILVLVGLIAGSLLLWKLASFISEVSAAKQIIKLAGDNAGYFYQQLFKDKAEAYLGGINDKLKLMGGIILIAAGAVLVIKGYCDAWVNGIDWGNFATIMSGIALIIGGIALAFSPLAAAIATVISGVALIVLGIKDFITNGYSMQNVIMIAVGAILVLVGAVWALNTAVLANPISWVVVAIVAAILALVATFTILWNECEGFRNFWIQLWEKAKVLFAQFVESIKPLINAIVGAFKEAWELIKVIWNNYLVPLFKAAWEAIKAVWNAVKPYFQMCWNNIKVIFSVVKEILGAYFRAAWEAIKIVWNQVVSYFTAIWNTIKGIFSVVKNVLSGNWKGAWDAIKGIVNTWKAYFANTWENIKKIFSVVGTFFKSAFGSAWEGIKSIFNNVKTFFTGVWNSIKSIFSNVGTAIAGAITNTVKSAINGVLSTAVGIINGFISAINLAISAINIIPGVNIKKLNKLEVPKLATGGIVTAETLARIGEGGKKEAVLPLEQNTGWMDILADRLASKQGTPSKLVLMLDGRELGYATINSINNITKQTGTLQLAMI